VASYNVLLKRSAAKELERLPDKIRRQVVARITALGTQPRLAGCEKLTGEDQYRIRQGDYRIVYAMVDADLIVHVSRSANRRDA
jgi:mRNA interferase RelE/StbE